MEPAAHGSKSGRVWVRATTAICLSAASSLAYLAHVGQGIVVGALIGLPGREQDIAIAQQRSAYWLFVSLFCQAAMIAAIAPLMPFASDEKPITGFIVRGIFAGFFSLTLSLLVGMVMFSVGVGFHRLHTR